MLSKPENGWSVLTLFDIEAEASYLVDIPFEWIKTCYFGITNKLPITLFIDEEEGKELYITSYYDVTHIISSDNGSIVCKTYNNYDFMDLTNELIEDIEKYYDDWIKWSPYEEGDLFWKKRDEELRILLNNTKESLLQEMTRCKKL